MRRNAFRLVIYEARGVLVPRNLVKYEVWATSGCAWLPLLAPFWTPWSPTPRKIQCLEHFGACLGVLWGSFLGVLLAPETATLNPKPALISTFRASVSFGVRFVGLLPPRAPRMACYVVQFDGPGGTGSVLGALGGRFGEPLGSPKPQR